jgi:hypothetical protein
MKYKLIYILSYGNVETGGPETLHQICNIFNKDGDHNAYMFYVNSKNEPLESPIPNKYKQYDIKIAREIEDSKDNLIIVPETISIFLRKFNRINKAIVFLSLDYFFPNYITRVNCSAYYRPLMKHLRHFFYLFFFLKYLIDKVPDNKARISDLKGCIVSYNCEYERNYLAKRGILANHYICGPISEDYFIASKSTNGLTANRKMQVLYNPQKGLQFTQKIIRKYYKMFPNDKMVFLPISNMSNLEIITKMLSSRIYMDFGYFPGPERLPRQAVLLGCNIVTSNNGAAKFDDVCIPKELKFKTSHIKLRKICFAIHDLSINYEANFHKFDNYRTLVHFQRDTFKDDVLNLMQK